MKKTLDAAAKRAGVKRIKCPECGYIGLGPVHPKPAPDCPKCGEKTKWRRDEGFHTLRHTFASHWLQQMASEGRDVEGCLKILQEILGHSDLKTTMRYTHVVEDVKRRAMSQFSIGPK